MLHILLLILKIIGIILLALLGLFLTAVLLFLFVPLRYRIHGLRADEMKGDARFTWLLHIFSAFLSYDGKAYLTVRLFGYPLIKRQVYPEEEQETEPGAAVEPEPDGTEPGTSTVYRETSREFHGAGEPWEREKPRGAGEMREPGKQPDSAVFPDGQIQGQGPKGRPWEPDGEPGGDEGTKEPEGSVEPEAPGEDEELQIAELYSGRGGAKRPGFFRSAWLRLKHAYQNFVIAIRRFCGTLKNGKESLEKVRSFFCDAENQRTLRLLVAQTKKLLRHLFPRRIRGWLRFGFEDPYRTGQALAAASPFYGLYARSISLEPVFGESVLEGELSVKGHIRIGTLMFIGLRVLMNKNFRVLLKKWMR